mgnify:CR=1 FL=1
MALDAGVAVPGGFAVAHGDDAGDVQGKALGGKTVTVAPDGRSGHRTTEWPARGPPRHNTAMPAHHDARVADFSSLFQFLPIGAYRTGPDGTMLRVNPAFVALAGYDDEAQMLADMNLSDEGWYVVPRRRAEFRRLLDRDGFVRGFVSEVQRFDSGQTLWVSENAHLVRGADGRPLYYEGTVEDVSDRVRDQQRLRQSEERLRLTTNNAETLLFSALAGLGIAHLPTWLISDYLLRGELLPLFCENGLPAPEPSGIYALRLERETDSRSRLLLEFLKARFGPVAPWDLALQSGLQRS